MKALPPILVTIGIVLLLTGGYVAAYRGLATRSVWPDIYGRRGKIAVEHIYTQRWQCTVFKPAAWIESRWTGHRVYTIYVHPDRLPAIKAQGLPAPPKKAV